MLRTRRLVQTLTVCVNMRNIESIKNDLRTSVISVTEAQRLLSSYMHSQEYNTDIPVSSNRIEKEIAGFDNELEKIIFTIKEKDQIKAAINVLDKAALFLSNETISNQSS